MNFQFGWVDLCMFDFYSFEVQLNIILMNIRNMQNYNSLWQCDTYTFFDVLYNIIFLYRKLCTYIFRSSKSSYHKNPSSLGTIFKHHLQQMLLRSTKSSGSQERKSLHLNFPLQRFLPTIFGEKLEKNWEFQKIFTRKNSTCSKNPKPCLHLQYLHNIKRCKIVKTKKYTSVS